MDAAGVDAAPQRDPRPIVEVLAANTGSHDNRLALIATVAGSKLRFTGAVASVVPAPGEAGAAGSAPAGTCRLEITQFAPYDQLQPSGRSMESSDPGAARKLAEAAAVAVDGAGTGGGASCARRGRSRSRR